MKNPATHVYGLCRKGADSLQSPLLLLIRLYWGVQFAQTGLGKLRHIGHVTHFFAQLGLPVPHITAVLISLLELCGGILLAVGLASRPVALLLAADMIVAYIVSDRAALTAFFSDPGTFYAAAPFSFLAASLVILIFGPGLFALDSLIARFSGRGRTPKPRAAGARR